LNDPFCSNAAVTGAAKIANAFDMPRQPPKIVPSRWESATPYITWFIGSVLPTAYPKQPVDQFSHFCTPHCRVSNNFTMVRYVPQK